MKDKVGQCQIKQPMGSLSYLFKEIELHSLRHEEMFEWAGVGWSLRTWPFVPSLTLSPTNYHLACSALIDGFLALCQIHEDLPTSWPSWLPHSSLLLPCFSPRSLLCQAPHSFFCCSACFSNRDFYHSMLLHFALVFFIAFFFTCTRTCTFFVVYFSSVSCIGS